MNQELLLANLKKDMQVIANGNSILEKLDKDG